MSLRSILPRHVALVVTSVLLFSSHAAAAPPPIHSGRPVLQTITVTPSNGTVLTTSIISPLQVAWCDPTASMVGHTITWQGQLLTGETQSWTSRPGCGNQMTSSFGHVAVDFTKPLTLVTSATDRSGQVTTTTTTYTMSASLVHLAVTPPTNQTTTVQRGVAGSIAFTVTNSGTVRAPAHARAVVRIDDVVRGERGDDHARRQRVADDNGQLPRAGRILDSEHGVARRRRPPPGGQNITRSASTLVRTPDAEPWVNPKAAAGTTVVVGGGQSAAVNFTAGSNPANSSGTYTLYMACPASWGCAADSSQVTLPSYATAVTTSVTAPPLIGSSTSPPATIQLVASLWDGTRLVAADTGVVQGYLAYHAPRLSPHSTAASAANGAPHTDSFTLTNNGNAGATYTLAGVCGSLGANGCTTNVPSITLGPGASGAVSLSYTPPSSGPISGTVKLIAKYQAASLVEADTASVLVTSGDVTPPTMSVTPSEGAVLTTRAVNAVVSVCDSDGIVGAPTLTANGSAVSGSFVSATQSGCATAGSTTFGVSAQPGTNTLVASVSDGVHTTTSTRTFVYDEAVELTPTVVALTPARVRPAQAAAADTFTVRNPGSLGATYSLAAGCTAAVSGCSASQSSISLGAGQTTSVVVSFTAGAASGNATVSLSATITGVTGHVITSSASASVMVDATPPTIAISPTGAVTSASPPTITVQWCDAEGGFLAHAVTLDGVSLPDAFASASAPGCAGAGTSTYPNLSMAAGAHTVGASATDAAGHVSTTSASITYSLPALSDFRPEVTPKNLSMDVFTGVSAQRTFTVRNAGVANASYQLAAVCPAITCQISKTSTALGVGATDSAVITFTPTSAMGPSATVGLRASYTDAASHVIADTGSVVATLAQMASHAVPSLTPLAPTMTVEPGVMTSYYFVLRNTGTLAATYDFSSVTAGGFSWPQGWAVFDLDNPALGPLSALDLAPGQSAQVYVMPASPTAPNVSGQITLTATFHASDGSVSSASGSIQVFTRSPDRGIGITPSVSVPLTVSVDRAVAYHEVTFTVINTGVMSGSYQYSAACHGFAQNCRLANGPASPFVLAAGATAGITIGYDATGADNGAGFNFIELFGTQVESGRQAVGTVLLSSSASPTVAASVTAGERSGFAVRA